MRDTPIGWRDAALPTLALFGSAATLVCCALPALLVSIGLGAAVAGLVSAAPQITWLSAHKAPVFAFAGVAIALAAWMHWRARSAPCPSDPQQARACARLRAFSGGAIATAGAAWAVGAFFAFLAPRLIA